MANKTKYKKDPRKYLPLLIILFGNFLLFASFWVRIQNERAVNISQAYRDAERNGQRVQMLFDNANNLTVMFGKEMQAMENRGLVDVEVERILADYYTVYNKSISSIHYAPDGMIRYIYPKVENKSWSIDLLDHEEMGQDARYSRDTGSSLISGPMELLQGGEGMVVSRPVYRTDENVGKDNFLGFVSVIVDLNHIIHDSSILSLEEDGYRYLLVKEGYHRENELRVIGNSGLNVGDDLSDTASYQFDVSDYRFTLSIIPKAGWINFLKNAIAFGLLEVILILMAFLIYANYLVREKSELLKKMSHTDQLTGLWNRTALREKFPLMVGESLTACMTDIDYFKTYNDTYGHEMGDTVLRKIAEIMHRYESESFQIFRFGGDEFLIWDTSGSEGSAISKIEAMMAEIDQIKIRGCEFPIHMTYGTYFGKAATADELRDFRYKADEKLYEKKQSRPPLNKQ